MKVRLATREDIAAVSAIYEAIHTVEEGREKTIGWIRGVYPTEKTAQDALEKGELYVMEREGRVVAAAKINQEQGEEYLDCPWQYEAAPEEVLVLHTLVVDPAVAGQGCGTAFVAVTNRDEDNLLMAMHAQRNGVPKVLAKMTRPNYMELVASTGIESIISPKDIVANQITRYCRALGNAEGSKVESLYKMLGGHVEALSFTATASAHEMLSIPLKDLKLKSNVLLATISKNGQVEIPNGASTIEPGDTVVIVTTRKDTLQNLNDIFA